jgi:hypothetical protein
MMMDQVMPGGCRTPRTDAGGRHDGQDDGYGAGRLFDQREIYDWRRPRGRERRIPEAALRDPILTFSDRFSS